MNRYLVLISVFLAVAACKTQRTIAPFVLRDSISITYKQGKEQPSPSGLRGAQTDFRKNSCVPADGSVGVGGATQGASVFEEVLSERTNKPAVPPTTIIRVDTVFVERWHTTEVKVESESEKSKLAKPVKLAKLVFYKNCTIGFWILLLLLIGRLAFRIMKAIYLRK